MWFYFDFLQTKLADCIYFWPHRITVPFQVTLHKTHNQCPCRHVTVCFIKYYFGAKLFSGHSKYTANPQASFKRTVKERLCKANITRNYINFPLEKLFHKQNHSHKQNTKVKMILSKLPIVFFNCS